MTPVARTCDFPQGTETAPHLDISAATGAPVSFCHPDSPWQRESNEGANGLLRQCFPNGISLASHSTREHSDVARELSEQPHAVLGRIAPAALHNRPLPSDKAPGLR